MRCRGMRDMLPPEMERFRRVERAFRDVCLGWGYGEVRTPTIEHLHLFTAAGTLSPQMLGRVYSFLDWDGWSGERVVLRPDSTIPAVRLYTEQMAAGPAKLFYVQNVLRFAQGDEPREDWQCGVELIGDTFPQGDVELVLMAVEVLQRLELPWEIRLSDPGILRSVFSAAGLGLAEQLALYDRVLDGDMTALDEVQARLPPSALSLSALLGVEGAGPQYLENLRSALLPAIPGAARPLDELAAVSDVLARGGVAHAISPALVRNFEYYTGPVFHLYSGGQKAGGGGRYDSLVQLAGGPDTPASGFALEIGVFAALLSDRDDQASRCVTVRAAEQGGADLAAAFALAQALRGAGCSVAIAPAGAPPSAREIIASAAGYTVIGEGGGDRRLTGIDEVVRTVAGTPS
jgi:histidyl-tRNA synthetase